MLTRRAQCEMTVEFLLSMLEVREGIQLVGIDYNPRREMVTLHLKGDTLPETPEGQESFSIALPTNEQDKK